VRSFIAIEIDDAIKARLADQIENLRNLPGGREVRWVQSQSIHLTLRFLGQIRPSLVAPIAAELRKITEQFDPFPLTFGDLGSFPNMDQPRVLWVGASDPLGRLESIRNSLEERLKRVGLEEERRPFHPHLTLGRMRRGVAARDKVKFGASLHQLKTDALGTQQIEHVSIFQSELLPAGAVHTVLIRANLHQS
jgi:RNA 2',3'-cyclic 3'-phosphodiesterase